MAKMKEMSIEYTAGLRANLGNFEGADVRLVRAEVWDVDDLTKEEVDALYLQRHAHLKATIDPIVEAGYNEVLGK